MNKLKCSPITRSIADTSTLLCQEHHQESIPHSSNSLPRLLGDLRFFHDLTRHARDSRALQRLADSLDSRVIALRAWTGSRSHDRGTNFRDIRSLCRLQGLCLRFHALHSGSWFQRIARQSACMQIPRRCHRRSGACCGSRDECRHV
jgi:hypothetical protein